MGIPSVAQGTFAVIPKVRAGWGSASRPDLRRGCRVTGIPTAIQSVRGILGAGGLLSRRCGALLAGHRLSPSLSPCAHSLHRMTAVRGTAVLEVRKSSLYAMTFRGPHRALVPPGCAGGDGVSSSVGAHSERTGLRVREIRDPCPQSSHVTTRSSCFLTPCSSCPRRSAEVAGSPGVSHRPHTPRAERS